MLDSNLENQLILPDIADRLVDYVSIQEDIDERRVKAAAIIAQNIDIKRIITQTNLNRCIGINENSSEADKQLFQLIVPPLCYFTYSRLLLNFQGNYTDSGYEIDELAVIQNQAKGNAKEMKSVGEAFMDDVLTFLKEEDQHTEATSEKLTPKIRVFGGKEFRASN